MRGGGGGGRKDSCLGPLVPSKLSSQGGYLLCIVSLNETDHTHL